MRSGELDRRVRLEALADTYDGDPTTGSWDLVAEVWASRVEGGRRRQVIADQDLASAERVYEIRYRTDVAPSGWRVNEDGELWRVDGVSEGEGRKKSLLLRCGRFDPLDREFD